MGEYFELTLFLDKNENQEKQLKKKILELLDLSDNKNQLSNHKYVLFANREVLFLEFEYDDAEFCQFTICFSELHFTKKNFEGKIHQLLQIADTCLSKIDSISFATGCYELTHYFIGDVPSLNELCPNTLSKFPILFFRKGQECDFKPFCTYNNTSCIINYGKDVQDIFSNPITELMEDEDLDINEAKAKLYEKDS